MKRQKRIGIAEEEFAAETYELLSQGAGQDTADYAAAVAAAIEAASAGTEQPEIPPSWIVPPGLPKPRLPGVGSLPGPLTPRSRVTCWPGFPYFQLPGRFHQAG